jgi:purine nucleoside phosphorylase
MGLNIFYVVLFIILKNRRYICSFPLAWIQSGFTKGDSAVNQLINITNDFGKALDSKEVRVVFCDISKAFDRVWHKGLIHKLKQSGISGVLFGSNFTSHFSDQRCI